MMDAVDFSMHLLHVLHHQDINRRWTAGHSDAGKLAAAV